jgi:hypothetical protein
MHSKEKFGGQWLKGTASYGEVGGWHRNLGSSLLVQHSITNYTGNSMVP